MIDLQASNLHCVHLSSEQCIAALKRAPDHILGAVGFSASAFSVSGDDLATIDPSIPFLRVPMSPLAADGVHPGTACELWQSSSPVRRGTYGSIRYACCEDLLFGAVQLEESDFVGNGVKTALQHAAEQAYTDIFSLLDKLKFPEILRFWNYVADINENSNGIERYRQFNMGRHDGFLRGGQAVAGSVPAASAVGYPDGPLTVYFLAARDAKPVPIENPRQVSAYRYPSRYGPRSPTFSRASVACLGDERVLFLSGTASIVGHETLHADDVAAQTRETMANIGAVLDEAARTVPEARFKLKDLCYKVYVRHESDAGIILRELCKLLGPDVRPLFLKADICREDLLMEIEATARHPMRF